MQKISGNWMGILAARVVCYTLCGGLSAALVGAFCIAIAGALTGAILDIQGTPANWEQGFIPAGFFVGATLGGIGGGVAGALIFALLGFLNLPERHFLPHRSTFISIWSGQICGTLGVCFSFFVIAAMAAAFLGKSFPALVDAHLIWILFGAPTLMVCGEIAGAIWSFRLVQK
ncbi:hypothetical protein B1R32_11747 [Abditibacterium utsteinense]|uniref:Uncharacterized protein n=1 Tax=Abditibacterium utsteinense TaxID=1960156 RepID=A0A2S8SQE0_9BACT|nr:hypothetical protein [Abditibacterium utsteinense]PQV63005.1 hypothetical protein B1R32_11747 [Abditibacterium utsteinense]